MSRAAVAAVVLAAGVLVPGLPAGASVPVVSISGPPADGDSGWYRAVPVLSVSASEPVSGVASLSFGFGEPATTIEYSEPFPGSVSEQTEPPSPGVHTLSAWAVSGTAETAEASLEVRWDPDAPSVPSDARWYTDVAGVVQTQSYASGQDRVCGRWVGSTDAVSGLRDYRVQVSESHDFDAVVVDRFTGSTATTACFDAADGVTQDRAYWFRVAARDVAGNVSAWSGVSNRVAMTDQHTGPAVAHAPVLAAHVGREVPISLTATCEDTGPCSARVLYRPTPISGAAAVRAGGWSRVELTEVDAAVVDDRAARTWEGSIPAPAVTSAGVDYLVEAEDSFAVTQVPGATYAGVSGVDGLPPVAHGYFHIHALTPPVVAHTPVPFGRAGEPVPVTVDAVCAGVCEATLYYRTTTGAVSDEPLLATPAWPRSPMQPDGPAVPVVEDTARVTFSADIPAEVVDTRGVDYFVEVTDGTATAWWPGSTYQGYVPTDGIRTGYHHVRVLETPHLAHTPVLTAPYRAAITVEAHGTCPLTGCIATLHYRTATPDPFAAAPMTVTALAAVEGGQVVRIEGVIPADVVDTRGVDYFIELTDGATTAWWPGTSHTDGYAPQPGVRVGHHHVRVLDPPQVTHVPVLAAPALQDLTVTAEITCATEACTATLFHATSPTAPAPAFTAVPMTQTAPGPAAPVGEVATWAAVIPADAVTTAGVAYFIEASDGYTTAYSPGTSYWGAYVQLDGQRVAAWPVRVLERPHLVHAPVLTAYYDQPIAIRAESNCSGTCAATLHWRTSGHPWQSTAMTAGPVSGLGVAGELWGYEAEIPAGDVTTEGVEYWVEVTDGYSTDSAPTWHVTVLAPTAVLHAPLLTAHPGQALPVEATVACSTPACSVTLSYREPAATTWTTMPMGTLTAPLAVGEATAVSRYHAVIPAEAVTTRGLDYFIHATDGHTNAYSPGTPYAATQFTRTDGTRAGAHHIHVAEPVRIAHAPVVVAAWREPIEIVARVTCATRDCPATLAYRASDGLTTIAGLTGYLGGGPEFTEVPMVEQVIADLGDAGVLLEVRATIPAEVATTEGVDYHIAVTDGHTSAYWPGTSYLAGPGTARDGTRAAWQHIEIPLRAPVRAITHPPVAASAIRQPITLRFAAYCTADQPCAATVWYRTAPNDDQLDLSQVLLAEPAWPTAAVRVLSAQPAGSGFVLHLFEADIPGEAVDSRGVDYLLKVNDSNGAMYWPAVPYESSTGLEAFPLIAHHVHTLTTPVIHHTPEPAAPAGAPVQLTWQVICSGDVITDCRTAAYHRHRPSLGTNLGTVDLGPVAVTVGAEPPAFAELPTTIEFLASTGDTYVLQATATIPSDAPAGSYDQYFLWAGDGHTNTYSPGTAYTGSPVPVDGLNLGQVTPWTIRRY